MHLKVFSFFLYFQVNDWQDDWVSFYAQQRLQYQLSLVEQSCGDREARELWAKLQVTARKTFLELYYRACLSKTKIQITNWHS